MTDKTILVVEDDHALLNGIADLLDISGYDVLQARNGLEALKILNTSNLPDLIISDIFMPKMDGYKLLESVRANPDWVSIPVIFLTAKGEKQDIRDGKLRGVDDYIPKPFDYEDLLAAVERGLNRHAEMLQWQESRMEALRQHILKIVNHEFRTPLTYIVAYADLLESNNYVQQSDELRQYIKGIMDGTERLTKLIENFLVLTELESGYGRTTFDRRSGEIHSLGPVIDGAMNRVRTHATVRNVRIEVEYTGSIPKIHGDAGYLQETIYQLLDNAVKFSPKNEGSVVNIELYAEKEYVIVAICDNGPGIPQEEQKLLFDLFYQVNRERIEQQGSGVGLTIVRHIAKLHKAKIKIKSAIDFGSCFELWIPSK